MNLLGERAFARLWTASLFAEMAEWMLQVALPVFIYQATGSAASTALTMVAGLLPMVVLSPLAGVLADRWDRRALLCAVCFGQALVALPLLGGGLSPVYLVMMAQSGLASLFEPARNALVPALVGADRLTAANGLMGMNSSVGRLVGSSLGGVVLGFAGLGWMVAVYLLFLVTAAGLLLPKFRDLPAKRTTEPEPLWRAWLDGLGEIRRNRRLRVTSGMVALISVGQGMFVVLFIVFVTGTLGGGEAETGLLRGVQAIGGLAAGFALAGVARRVTPVNLLGWGALTFGLVAAVIWNSVYLTTSLGVYIGLFIAIGLPVVVLNAGLLSVIQLATPRARTGRVLSTIFAGGALFQVAGMLGAGAIVGWAGPAVLLNAQAVLCIAAGTIALIALRRPVTTVEECPVSSPPVTST